MGKKDIYSVYNKGWGCVQIRKNDKTDIEVVAVIVTVGNGQYVTQQTYNQALRMARKIVRNLNK